MLNNFIFNNISSLDFSEIIVNSLPPIYKASKRVDKIEVPGRPGYLYKYNTEDSIVKPVKCTLKNTDNVDLIKSWLDGNGKVIFSNEPDRYYNAIIINQIPFDLIFRHYREFIIEFECDPYGYLIEGEETINITKSTTLYNPGNYYSEPYLKIYAQGDIQVLAGDSEFTIDNVVDYVEVDSDLLRCFKGTENKGNDKVGKYPKFEPGDNVISWIGNVSKIEIIPRWRCS